MMYIKQFDTWNKVKKILQKEKRTSNVNSGDIRWCSIGVNLGSEMDGKGKEFTRPVLVVKTVSSHLVLVVPLSTSDANRYGYISFNFKDQDQSLCILQLKVISQKRLLKRIGKINKGKLKRIKSEIREFFEL